MFKSLNPKDGEEDGGNGSRNQNDDSQNNNNMDESVENNDNGDGNRDNGAGHRGDSRNSENQSVDIVGLSVGDSELHDEGLECPNCKCDVTNNKDGEPNEYCCSTNVGQDCECLVCSVQGHSSDVGQIQTGQEARAADCILTEDERFWKGAAEQCACNRDKCLKCHRIRQSQLQRNQS